MQQYTLMMMFFLTLLLCDLFYYLDAKKCYVCGPSPHDLLENLNITTLTNNCTDLDHLWKLKKTVLAQETFGRECPEDYKSCLLQRDGNRKITIRSCEKLQLEDCQKANNVTYCYCLNDYCNYENVPDQPHILTSKDRRQQQQQLHHSISDEINDDEDLNDDEEASGSKEQNTRRDNSGFTTKSSDKTKTKKNSASRSLSSLTFIEILYYLALTIINDIRIS
ncbi:uncharacterized protein LOC129613018 [Condylostylus longicornis]|uniref:uncharacterized protein LOC129613018 n=1 Tax=Condylostylus longicornis TaxID=2530218 RepID=UPI00244D9DE9|nr:uncharacterized protein LOC129613018 [Condylostylus longicornis]